MKHPDVRMKLRSGTGQMAVLGLALMLLPAAHGASAQQNDDFSSQRINAANLNRTSLPSGTVIPVRLDEALSSKTSEEGQKFTATVIRGADDAGLPHGTRLEGIVREVTPNEGNQPGSMDVEFRRILYPDGSAQAITGSLYSLSGKALKRVDGRLVATVDKGKDRLKFIGIGAGAGLILGTLTKQNTLLSLLLGAGAGYLYNEVGNKPKPGDVNLKEGQEFGVRLDRQLNLNAQTRRYYRQLPAAQDPDMTGPGFAPSFRDQVRVLVNDLPVRFSQSQQPFIRSGTVFVPLAAMGKAAKFDYRYNAASRMVYARDDSVRTRLGSRVATVDGDQLRLPAAAEQRNGVTFVPLQFIAWAVEGEVNYDEPSGTVRVVTNARP